MGCLTTAYNRGKGPGPSISLCPKQVMEDGPDRLILLQTRQSPANSTRWAWQFWREGFIVPLTTSPGKAPSLLDPCAWDCPPSPDSSPSARGTPPCQAPSREASLISRAGDALPPTSGRQQVVWPEEAPSGPQAGSSERPGDTPCIKPSTQVAPQRLW